MLRDLVHPNIVKIIDVIKVDVALNLILEYAEQGSLLNVVKQFGTLPETLIASYLTQILQGLQYLHKESVVHCDM